MRTCSDYVMKAHLSIPPVETDTRRVHASPGAARERTQRTVGSASRRRRVVRSVNGDGDRDRNRSTGQRGQVGTNGRLPILCNSVPRAGAVAARVGRRRARTVSVYGRIRPRSDSRRGGTAERHAHAHGTNRTANAYYTLFKIYALYRIGIANTVRPAHAMR